MIFKVYKILQVYIFYILYHWTDLKLSRNICVATVNEAGVLTNKHYVVRCTNTIRPHRQHNIKPNIKVK